MQVFWCCYSCHIGTLRLLGGPWWINGQDALSSRPHEAHVHRHRDMDDEH